MCRRYFWGYHGHSRGVCDSSGAVDETLDNVVEKFGYSGDAALPMLLKVSPIVSKVLADRSIDITS